MKKRLIRLIVDACKYIDYKRKKLEYYEGETAPYCGHHYSGADGVLYKAYYREGEGYEEARFLGFVFGIDTDDDCWWRWVCRYKIVKDLYADGNRVCTNLAWTNISRELELFIYFNIMTRHKKVRYKYKIKKKW